MKTYDDIFEVARQLPADERSAYLDEACDSDDQRQRVDELLAEAEEADAFFDEGAPRTAPPVVAHGMPGDKVGNYTLRQRIGEGGFGVVWIAEQKLPLSRMVALKIVKAGMDTRQVLARFGAERQALAMMDHPNIAKVLDAGSTDSGRPYFVMELVRGIKLTDYCDQNKLTTRQRLELFIPICNAIQHAHQKGIIHRDIKPSNILVTLHDGEPIPKVIDFGIAKATEGRLTDATVYTRLHQFIGTPAYMSPEQAEMSGLDVDTRSDIYSLGVILYELLTGRTPFDPMELTAHGIDAMRRFIREEEPARPSTRLETLDGQELTATATRHAADKSQLVHQLRGDLDWIVMKCLEKDRTRRYETANGLAMDLQRYMNHELVTARPPSRLYRLRKAVRRNKLAFTGIAAVTVALLVAGTSSTLLAVQANRAHQEAEEAAGRERQMRLEAESRAKMTKAQSLFATGDQAAADTLAFQLPDDFIQRNAATLAPMFRALGHYHGGAMRWRRCADCYELLLLGPASPHAGLKDFPLSGWVTGHESPSKNLSPVAYDLAFLEAGPVLVELGDKERYQQLRDAGAALYRDFDQRESDRGTVRDSAERMLHACLLMPVESRNRVTYCKWIALVEEVKDLRMHHATVLALSDIRRGRHREALKWAAETNKLGPSPQFSARAQVLVAMAHTGLGEHAAAKRALARAHESIDPNFKQGLGVGSYGALWADWLIDRVLLREAEERFAATFAPDGSVIAPNAANPSVGDRREWDEAMERARRELALASPAPLETKH